ncbi:hypothetical protein ANCCAN_27363 [Ancylostoma caninum]|uniref:Uncharacterized protein n=1 Tax=Ancylostoma caninum TaxID=29170 RepID=A0A368F785_ANCCA|nr:hypothetical protein ANCCAN_27363 [Ancylostoma caninum]
MMIQYVMAEYMQWRLACWGSETSPHSLFDNEDDSASAPDI